MAEAAVEGALSHIDSLVVGIPITEPEAPHRAHVREIRTIMALSEPSADVTVINAAAYVLQKAAKNRPKAVDLTRARADEVLLQYTQFILDKGDYLYAAKLVWGDALFTADPRSVQMIWDEIPLQAELMVMGAGSMGKSYSVGVWLLLDWIRDPTMTCIKVISSTESHAKRNVFAHIKNLHASASFALPGDRKDKSIQVGDDDKQGIHLMTIPQGDEGKGRLRGFHPVPRGTPHPKFGILSRIRCILDEAEEIPQGVWEEVSNILITRDGVEHVKVIAASNPKDRNSKFGLRCEPEGGWTAVDIETSEKWMSKLGCMVLRLDGAKCENVIQRKMVFPGLITWEGYRAYLLLGDTSPEYYTMARGWFPEQGLHVNVIPPDFVEKAKGSYIFSSRVTYCASVDLAFEGGDLARMTIGRFGMVSGWTPLGKPTIMFDKLRYGLQIESQFDLAKTHPTEKPTVFMTRQIKETCKNLRIGPDWLIVDRTGNGTGVHDLLCGIDMGPTSLGLGPSTMGLHWGDASTDRKVLEDDSQKASELYDGVVTELFFSARKYLEFDFVKFSLSMLMDRLTKQLTDRRFKPSTKKRVRIESKKEYKARGNDSPDDADSFTMLIHLVRIRSEFAAAMLVNMPEERRREVEPSPVDSVEFLSFE